MSRKGTAWEKWRPCWMPETEGFEVEKTIVHILIVHVLTVQSWSRFLITRALVSLSVRRRSYIYIACFFWWLNIVYNLSKHSSGCITFIPSFLSKCNHILNGSSSRHVILWSALIGFFDFLCFFNESFW